ncbi:MAG TPA: trypsin-like peptidase domain-containing protein [Variovorax sp.]|nr:trypsin-like peptidase domain-containing protein [Variovorax sp.]
MKETKSVERACHVHDVLKQRAAREAAPSAAGMESGGAGVPVHPDDVLARLDSVVKCMPADEVGDPAEFKKALNTLLQHGDPALRKLLQDDTPTPQHLSGDEVGSLEAIIVADGSRPSFLLREGTYPKDHPFLGSWQDEMKDYRDALRRTAACVGRLQVPQGSSGVYNGTGTLVPALDKGEFLVLTNLHVVEHARNKSGVKMVEAPDKTRLSVKGDWVIDFIGESANPARNRWRVREVRLPKGAGVSFSGVDAAVLRIESFSDESKLPEAAVRLSGLADYALGEGSASLVTIGFPGEPNTATPAGAQIDWNFVIKTLFNNRFGLKRVAPGRFKTRVGSVPEDTQGHVLSHDATTFGGASGSLLFAWREEAEPAFALHFAGANSVANYAVSLHKAAAALRETGLKID